MTIDHQGTNLPQSIQDSLDYSYYSSLWPFQNSKEIWKVSIKNMKEEKISTEKRIPKRWMKLRMKEWNKEDYKFYPVLNFLSSSILGKCCQKKNLTFKVMCGQLSSELWVLVSTVKLKRSTRAPFLREEESCARLMVYERKRKG